MPDHTLVRVHLGNAHHTSGGSGPGMVRVPLAEARWLAERRYDRILGPDEQPGDLARTHKHAHGVSN